MEFAIETNDSFFKVSYSINPTATEPDQVEVVFAPKILGAKLSLLESQLSVLYFTNQCVYFFVRQITSVKIKNETTVYTWEGLTEQEKKSQAEKIFFSLIFSFKQ